MRNTFESAVKDAPQALTHPDEFVPPIIDAEKATHEFANGVGVFDLTFQIPGGLICGLIGPSGCGKTTTVRMLSGMYRPTSGKLTVLGESTSHFRPGHVKRSATCLSSLYSIRC